MWSDAMILVFLILSFKTAFSLSPFTFIKRLFSSSLLSAIRMMSSAYLRLLVFFLAVLISGYDSSSPAFHMMYSAYKLNKQIDKIQPWCTPFPILNQSIFPCQVLSVASLYIVYKGLEQSRILIPAGSPETNSPSPPITEYLWGVGSSQIPPSTGMSPPGIFGHPLLSFPVDFWSQQVGSHNPCCC